MMDDVGTVLLDEVQRRFREVCDEDIAMGVLNRILETDRANAEYAGLYADRVGELLAQVYAEMVSSERLPDGRMYWNIAQKVVQEPLVNNYRLAAVAAEKAQKAQNRRAGIGLNAVRPELNEERVKGIMNKVSEAADYDEAASMLDRPVVNMTRAVVDDSVKANAAFQSESGLGVKVVRRTTGAHPCDWCKSLAGTYDYEKVKGGHDVWRRHLDCHCVIEVVSSKGTERVNNYRPSGRRDEAALEARRSAPAVEMPTRAEIEARKAFTEEHERGVRDKKHSSGNVPGFGKYTQKDLKVNVDLVMSPAYRRKFDRITDDPAVNQALCDASRTMLMHRSGSDLEDMVLIDAKTGLIVGKQDRSITAHQVDYNESLSNAAAEHRLTGGLISVHNHNLNFLPSADDFRSQFIHSYDFGIVVCHDGKVIKYQLDEEKGDVSKIFEGTVAKSYKAHYNRLIESGFAGNAEQRAMMMAEQEAVEHLQAEYGLKYEVY